MTDDRHWLCADEDNKFGRWVYPSEIHEALATAERAIYEYDHGDRSWAEWWLLNAFEANKK